MNPVAMFGLLLIEILKICRRTALEEMQVSHFKASFESAVSALAEHSGTPSQVICARSGP